MNKKIKIGNLNNDSNTKPKRRGWIIGKFIEKFSLFHEDAFEMKWGVHKKGEIFKDVRARKDAKTISI